MGGVACESALQKSLQYGWKGFKFGEIQDPRKGLQDLLMRKQLFPQFVNIGSLKDLISSPDEARQDKDGNTMKFEFWRKNGYPSPVLTSVMRSIVDAVKHIEYFGITHWNLKPCCLSMMCSPFPLTPEDPYMFDVGLSEECYKEENGRVDAQATDIFVALGELLLFCITGGTKADSATKKLKTSSGHSAYEQGIKKDLDFTGLKNIPEAMDLIPALLNPRADKRWCVLYDARDLRRHPLFWCDCFKFHFMCDVCVEMNAKGGPLLDSLVRVASDALHGSTDESDQDDEEKIKSVLKHLEQDLYVCHYKSKVRREFDYERERTRYYMTAYPRLFFEMFKVMREHDPDFITDFVWEKLY